MGYLNHFVHYGSPTANEEPLIKYIKDFLTINPMFGELQEIKNLTTAAKQEGNKNVQILF